MDLWSYPAGLFLCSHVKQSRQLFFCSSAFFCCSLCSVNQDQHLYSPVLAVKGVSCTTPIQRRPCSKINLTSASTDMTKNFGTPTSVHTWTVSQLCYILFLLQIESFAESGASRLIGVCKFRLMKIFLRVIQSASDSSIQLVASPSPNPPPPPPDPLGVGQSTSTSSLPSFWALSPRSVTAAGHSVHAAGGVCRKSHGRFQCGLWNLKRRISDDVTEWWQPWNKRKSGRLLWIYLRRSVVAFSKGVSNGELLGAKS